MKYNIIRIDEMINTIEDFFADKSQHVLYVGGMVGTELFSYVTSEASNHYHFNHMLFLEGCQDYLGLSKDDLPNYWFYPAILEERLIDPIIPYDPFKAKWVNPKREYATIIDINKLTGFMLLIINNAHLISNILMKDIIDNFDGKIVVITDPFDVGGDIYSGYPTIVDTYVKLPVIQALARKVYGIETMAIDKNKSSLTECKMQNRSIGKIDDKQYISNDPEIISTIREKQYKSDFRKNQKLIVSPENERKIYVGFGDNQNLRLVKNSMMTVDVSQINPWMDLRIHNSKMYFKGIPTYSKEDDEIKISVEPANIISIDQSIHHRFKNSVLVLNNKLDITPAQRYSIMKNTNNLQVVFR